MIVERIRWQDPTGFAEWISPEKVDSLHPAKCTTVGFVISEDDNTIRIAASFTDDGDIGDLSVIPKDSILDRVVLHGGKED